MRVQGTGTAVAIKAGDTVSEGASKIRRRTNDVLSCDNCGKACIDEWDSSLNTLAALVRRVAISYSLSGSEAGFDTPIPSGTTTKRAGRSCVRSSIRHSSNARRGLTM